MEKHALKKLAWLFCVIISDDCTNILEGRKARASRAYLLGLGCGTLINGSLLENKHLWPLSLMCLSFFSLPTHVSSITPFSGLQQHICIGACYISTRMTLSCAPTILVFLSLFIFLFCRIKKIITIKETEIFSNSWEFHMDGCFSAVS